MRPLKSVTLAVVVLGLLVPARDTSAALGGASTVLIVPARERVVQLAFQVAQLEPVTVVAYSAVGGDVLTHVWNGSAWDRVDLDALASGSFLASGRADRAILVGGPAVLPRQLAADPTWADQVQRIPVMNVATMVNEIGTALKFAPHQWVWIARQNGLQLKDENALRRKYGKYGPPGQSAGPAKPGVSMPEMPPAPAAEEPLPVKAAPRVAPPVAPAVAPPPAPEKLAPEKLPETKPAPPAVNPANK